jgi:hypothetical protein
MKHRWPMRTGFALFLQFRCGGADGPNNCKLWRRHDSDNSLARSFSLVCWWVLLCPPHSMITDHIHHTSPCFHQKGFFRFNCRTAGTMTHTLHDLFLTRLLNDEWCIFSNFKHMFFLQFELTYQNSKEKLILSHVHTEVRWHKVAMARTRVTAMHCVGWFDHEGLHRSKSCPSSLWSSSSESKLQAIYLKGWLFDIDRCGLRSRGHSADDFLGGHSSVKLEGGVMMTPVDNLDNRPRVVLVTRLVVCALKAVVLYDGLRGCLYGFSAVSP